MISEVQNTFEKPMRIVPLNKVPTIPAYEWVLISTLRQWVFHSEPRFAASGQAIAGNGFGSCVVRIGRRVFIDLDQFDLWIAQHRQSKEVTNG